MLTTILALLPQFKALVDQIKDTLSSDDQEVLQDAYELAKKNSDDAHTDLQRLVAERTGLVD